MSLTPSDPAHKKPINIQILLRSKRNVINKAIASIDYSKKAIEKVKDCQSQPLTSLLELMDKFKGAREKAEGNPRYWEHDKELKEQGYLPDDYIIKDLEEKKEEEKKEEEKKVEEKKEEESEEEETELSMRASEFCYKQLSDKEAYDEAKQIHAEIVRVKDYSAYHHLGGLEYSFKHYEKLQLPKPEAQPEPEAEVESALPTLSSVPLLPSPPESEHEFEPEVEGEPETKLVVLSPLVNVAAIEDMRKKAKELRKKGGHVSACKARILEARVIEYENEAWELERKEIEEECIEKMAELEGMIKKSRKLAKKYRVTRDRNYYEIVPKACTCSLCLEKKYPGDEMPNIIMDEEGDDEGTRFRKYISRDAHRHKVEKEKTMQMHMLKKLHVDKWYDLSWNREVIEYCFYYKIESDNHMVVHEVKKRISGIDFNPCMVLPSGEWRERRHNNWFMPDISKEMVKKSSLHLAEGRMGCSYLKSLDKLPARIEYIATKRINQQPFTDKRSSDMGWETRRKRLCYYYYRWFGVKSYHPQMFESSYMLCLMRIARVMRLSLEVRLFSLLKDQDYLREMREDIYKLFLVKEKNWGQKDILASYYTCAGAYLRQMYLECQILVKEFGDEVRDKIPECFYWVILQRPRQGVRESNTTVNRSLLPKYIDYNLWRKKQAARNKNTPLEDIMMGKFDEEADKIWFDDPYFMDPQKLYELHQAGHISPDFNRRVAKYRASKVFDEGREHKIMFKEFEGSNKDDIGKDFQRFKINFCRPKKKPAWVKPRKLTEQEIIDQAVVMFNYDKDEVRSIRDLPALKIGYSNLFEEIGFNVDFPGVEVDFTSWWKKEYIEDYGSPDPDRPVVYYKEENSFGVMKTFYHINKMNLKAKIKDEEFKKVYKTVNYYQKLVGDFRRGRRTEGCCFYEDMNMMFGINHLEEKYHLSGKTTLGKVIFEEFDAYCVENGVRKDVKCDYLDKVAEGHIKNMMMIHESESVNPIIAYECFEYYFLTYMGMMRPRLPQWKCDTSREHDLFMKMLGTKRSEVSARKNAYLYEIGDSANFVVNMFAKKLRSQDKHTSVFVYPRRPLCPKNKMFGSYKKSG